MIQNPFHFATPEIRSNVLQNTGRHEWFRQGSPEAARLAAEDVAIPTLDPLQVHHVEARVRSVDAGFERVPTTSLSEWADNSGRRGRSRTHGSVLWPRRREVVAPQPRYTTLADQILLIQKELMLLQPGYRFVRGDRVTTAPEYVPLLRDPWPADERPDCPLLGSKAAQSSAEAVFRSVLEAMKRRPVYRPARDPFMTPPAPASGQDSAARVLAARSAENAPVDPRRR